MNTQNDTAPLLPPFSTIHMASIESELNRILQDNRRAITQLPAQPSHPTWDNLMHPLEDLSERLEGFWAPISHLNSVMHSETLRAVYHACLPPLSDYATELSHNRTLYEAIQTIFAGPEYQTLNQPQRKVIENELRDFK